MTLNWEQMPDLMPRADLGMMFQRIESGLKDDSIATMLDARVLRSMALTLSEAAFEKEVWTAGTAYSDFYEIARDRLAMTPLGGLASADAVIHLAKVATKAVFPATYHQRQEQWT